MFACRMSYWLFSFFATLPTIDSVVCAGTLNSNPNRCVWNVNNLLLCSVALFDDQLIIIIIVVRCVYIFKCLHKWQISLAHTQLFIHIHKRQTHTRDLGSLFSQCRGALTFFFFVFCYRNSFIYHETVSFSGDNFRSQPATTATTKKWIIRSMQLY